MLGQITICCSFCRQEFSVVPSRKHKAKYCSKSCFRSARQAKMVSLQCEWCGKDFTLRAKLKCQNRRFCSVACAAHHRTTRPGFIESAKDRMKSMWAEDYMNSSIPAEDTVILKCERCQREFTALRGRRHRFCQRSCAVRWRWEQPGLREKYVSSIRQSQSPGKRAASSSRMKVNNPVANPEIREKISRSLQGRTFLARGGNGQFTKPQMLLADALGWEMEHAICTAPVKGMFPSLPHCYKVDIADSTVRLAIEVDGRSHRSPRWRYLDNRKEEILRALGWKVLRFDNERVLDDLHGVVTEVSTLWTSLQN